MSMIFELIQENLELSKTEVLSLIDSKEYILEDNLLIINETVPKKIYERFAYTKYCYELLFESKEKDLIEKLKNYSWEKVYETNFCARIHKTKKSVRNINLSENEIAGIIWKDLKNPKVELRKPVTEIVIMLSGKSLRVCKKIILEKEKFEDRRAHLRPEKMPTGMHPKLARCCVNLTGIKEGIFVDPMCGAGGFLFEAELMGFKSKGYDIDETVLKKAKINLEHYNIFSELKIKDVTKLKEELKYVATDMPYGHNAKLSEERDELYKKVFKTLEKRLTGTAVIILPDCIDFKSMLNETKLVLKKELEMRMHNSLTRKILIIENNFFFQGASKKRAQGFSKAKPFV